ncbi:hypothetical protein RI367_007496 [Sorochytrium milnesiophthora]
MPRSVSSKGSSIDGLHTFQVEVSTEQTAQPFNQFTLTFVEEADERAYAKFFVQRNLRKWRAGLVLIVAAGSLLYAYSMVKSQSDVQYFVAKTQGQDLRNLAQCPTGFYCSECLPNFCDSSYHVEYDVMFYLFGILIPGVVAFALSYKLKLNTFAMYMHHISTIVLLIGGTLSMIIRFYIMEPKGPVYVSALILACFLFAYYIFMRVRFVFAAVSVTFLVILYIIMNIIRGQTVVIHAVPDDISYVTQLVISSVSMMVIGAVICVSCYEVEWFHRTQFQHNQHLQRANNKLNHQLKTIQKSFQISARNFDSPLERSIAMVRSCMADAGVSPHVSLKLGNILALLSSHNLLTPDMENVITEKGARLDNEQEAWLFSEVARRRGDNRSQRGSMVPKRASIIAMTNTSGFLSGQTARKMSSGPTSPQTDRPLRHSSTSLAGPLPEISEMEELNFQALEPYQEQLCEYNFPIFDYVTASQNRPLSCMMMQLFRRSCLFESLELPQDKFWKCISTVEQGYHSDLPYHNRVHAADVLQTISCLASLPQVTKFVTDADLLAIYFAAAIHDYDHPGFNNNYLITTNDSKAILYNDKAVLENHHLAASFRILLEEGCNFVSHFTKSEYKAFREVVVEMVLATDLSQHLPIVTMFKNRASQGTMDPDNSREDRLILFKTMMKLADVGNPTKTWSIYERWYQLVIDEFFRQGDIERKSGLDVSPFMDREKVNIPSSQIGFIDFIVSPLFTAFHLWAPITSIVESLATNREIWADRKQKQEEAAAAVS